MIAAGPPWSTPWSYFLKKNLGAHDMYAYAHMCIFPTSKKTKAKMGLRLHTSQIDWACTREVQASRYAGWQCKHLWTPDFPTCPLTPIREQVRAGSPWLRKGRKIWLSNHVLLIQMETATASGQTACLTAASMITCPQDIKFCPIWHPYDQRGLAAIAEEEGREVLEINDYVNDTTKTLNAIFVRVKIKVRSFQFCTLCHTGGGWKA